MNLKNKIKVLQQEGINSNCYYLINSNEMLSIIEKCGKDKEKLEYFYNLCEGWDKDESAIPLELGEYIESLVRDPNIQFGIHRSSDVEDKDSLILKNIMFEGLRNDAAISQGVFHDIPEVTKTVSLVNSMFHTLPMLKGSYKGSNGSILISFPKEYLDSNNNILPEHVNDFYEYKNNGYYIKSEYIMGYLVAEYGVYNLYTKEDILNRGR